MIRPSSQIHGRLRRSARRSAFVVALAALALPGPALAQSADTWKAEAELGGAFFFGNTSAITLTTRTAASVADSTREIAVDGVFTYGEATDPEGISFVNKRSWAAGMTFDLHPFARVSPFALVRIESSFEQRIDQRYSLGAGAKLTVLNEEASELDVSLAMLGDRLQPRGTEVEADTRLRWSGRLRGRRELAGGRVTLSSVTFYRPLVEEMENFTLTSTNSAAFVLSDRISLKVSFVDNYDSQAEERGARSNNDGQVLITILSAF